MREVLWCGYIVHYTCEICHRSVQWGWCGVYFRYVWWAAYCSVCGSTKHIDHDYYERHGNYDEWQNENDYDDLVAS